MEKVKKLKEFFKSEKIDGYIISKNDEFFCEYVPSHNDRLSHITNFTGSFGFALILKKKNYLFVDGRYTLQAKNQSGKYFKIFTIPQKIPSEILKNKDLIIGFDSKLFTKKMLNTFFGQNSCRLMPIKKNLVDEIWKRKIKKKINKFYNLPNYSVGFDYVDKVKKVVSFIKKQDADYQFISASENNAWLLNIRGRDTDYTPIPFSYILINKNKEIKFFCDLKKINGGLRRKFNNIEFIQIELVGKVLSNINKKKFIIDQDTCSYYFENIILKNNTILSFNDSIYKLKAIKSKEEIQNIKKAHIYDGAALTKYLFWLKKNFYKKKITEMSASKKLFEFRKKNNKFKFLSFPTISGTGPNGAIIHYKATKKTNRQLKIGDIYLCDSGGQYEFGTTDVTRTISLQNSNKRVKNIFTRVLKGHLAVANYKFKKKSFGSEIDKLARKYLKQINLDYAHGTGHGVGYFLNVHEGPHAISRFNKINFEEGMIVSNEPGYYENKKFGIRIENLIYVKKDKGEKCFDNLTMVPIDKDLIDQSILNKKEKNWLNNYHSEVFKKLKNQMNNKEILELQKACLAI
ncbi:aminopeptidase P family protein [Candidatus Pelagibacter bacterium]|nr:aminopeptidase P family protein [Candidatus Pelagibacter bacterium]